MSRIVSHPTQVVPSAASDLLDAFPDWQSSMRNAVRDPRVLCARLGISRSCADRAVDAMGSFPLFAPEELIRKIRHGDPRDPILLQILPDVAELESPPGFVIDPVGDGPAEVVGGSGLLKKYHGRALWITTGACPVHCRYCFRRHYDYEHSQADRNSWDDVIRWLTGNPDVQELILSGGDPLTWSDTRLNDLCTRLTADVPHLRRLRIHTRMPAIIPQRVTRRLVQSLSSLPWAIVVVVHINHPNEIDEAVAAGLRRLVTAGFVVLNQSVLLKQVNDHAVTLEELCLALVNLGVLPYYLHQLDPVQGAAHFAVPTDVGTQLMATLRSRLPGYALPRYVVERPGELSKVSLEGG